MKTTTKAALFFLFFLSGFCSLLYQVIWLRLAFASFGVITPILSVVISVFMGGLFVGSWFGGKWVEKLVRQSKKSELIYYALAEAVIGLGAFCVPKFFKLGESFLLTFGESNSASYLFLSSAVIAASLLPWCIAMGATFPFVLAFIKKRSSAESQSFSLLYLANVIGAMTGTLLSAYVLIEIFGFRNTLYIGAAFNFLIAVIAIAISRSGNPVSSNGSEAYSSSAAQVTGSESTYPLLVLFATGFVSMGFEVLWTRGFTPILKTTIYAFAELLAAYLFATWIGSLAYRIQLAKKKVLSTDRLLYLTAIAGFAPVIFNDPRLHPSSSAILISVIPFCALLGYLTPKLIDEYGQGNADRSGRAYAINILGCIFGPLVTSYLLLPAVGVKLGIVAMATLLVILSLTKLFRVSISKIEATGATVLMIASLLIAGVVNVSYEERYAGDEVPDAVIRRDHTATIVSSGTGRGKALFVNGIGITGLTPITKIMAHLPLAMLKDKPESALVICFGMGTTFRALLSWGIDVTAVELVPSVRDAFPFYHADAKELLAQPRARIIVDDGRRFLRRTGQQFDLVTLDPPPPIEAAASSLLHSEEFYAAVKDRLKPNGVFQQWFPGESDNDSFQVVVRAIVNQFPYVRVYHSMEQWGYHFIASRQPLPDLTAEEVIAKLPEAARADLTEWSEGKSAVEYINGTVKNQRTLAQVFDPKTVVTLTDDRPFNEYFYMRRKISGRKN